VSGFRFLLRAVDGADLGEFNVAVPDWQVGDVFDAGGGRRFRIVSIAPFLVRDLSAGLARRRPRHGAARLPYRIVRIDLDGKGQPV
jgi:hypothetical protein